MNRRLFVAALIVCFAIAPLGIAAEKKALSDITIGITGHNFGVDSYETTYERAFTEECEFFGVNLIKLDSQGDPVRQVSQVEDLIQKKVDVIVIWPVSGKGIVPVLKKADEAGIPVLISNSPVDESGYEYIKGYTGPDNVLEGRYAGESMVELLDGKGKVVEIMGLPGYVTAIERSEGFHEVIENAPEIEIIETQPGNWDREKSQQVMENFLVKYGPGEFHGVYVADDNMGMGAVNALKAAGRLDEVVITSACLFGEGYDAIQRGEIGASVVQDPVEDASIAVRTAIEVARGKTIPFFNYFVTPKITQENLDQFHRPVF